MANRQWPTGTGQIARELLGSQPAMNLLANRRVHHTLAGLGQITLLARDTFASLLRLRVKWRDVLFQMYFIGVKSQTVVLITGAFTGMVLGAQTYFQFHKIKMDTASLAVVGGSMRRGLGPVRA